MARDSNLSIAERLEQLRDTLVDDHVSDNVKALRKKLSAAGDQVLLASHACHNMAGLQGTAEALAEAKAGQRKAGNELHRAERAVCEAARAAVPEFHSIATEIADLLTALADTMAEVDRFVVNTGRQRLHPLKENSIAFACSRAMRALSEQLGPPKAPPKTATIRWTA